MNESSILLHKVVGGPTDDLLRILIVPREKSGMNLDVPHKKILSVMGEDCKIKWEIVDEIPKPPSGKYLYVRSLVTR